MNLFRLLNSLRALLQYGVRLHQDAAAQRPDGQAHIEAAQIKGALHEHTHGVFEQPIEKTVESVVSSLAYVTGSLLIVIVVAAILVDLLSRYR